MAKWRQKNIYIYFNDIFGSMGENCLPYMPESFTCNINGRNEEIDILHGVGSDEGLAGTMNFVKRPGLKTWSIECFFSHPDRPLYATVSRSHRWTPEFWVEFFESAMYQRKVLEMTVSGLNIVTYVTIENFKHTKEAGEEIDTYYTIEIKEYQFQEIKQEAINIVQEIPKYDGQNTNQQQTIANINVDNNGNIVWLNDYGYKDKDLKNNYIYLSRAKGTTGFFTKKRYDVNEGKAFFNWLPVEVVNKITNNKKQDTLTILGEYIVNKFTKSIFLNESSCYGWLRDVSNKPEYQMSLKNVTNINEEAAELQKYILDCINKQLGTNYPNFTAISTIGTKKKINDFVKNFILSSYNKDVLQTLGIVANIKGVYAQNTGLTETIYQLKSTKEFYIPDYIMKNNAKETDLEGEIGQTKYETGTIIYSNSYELENKNNIPFSVTQGSQ